MFSVCLSTGKEAMMFCRVAKRKAIGEQLGDKRHRTSDKDFGFFFFFKLWVKEDTPGRCEQRNGRMVLICMQYEKLHYEGEKAEAETQEAIILRWTRPGSSERAGIRF